MGRRRRWLPAALVVSGLVLGTAPAAGAARNPGETPARSRVSNMGLCSAYLGQLGARAQVNALVRKLGPFLPDGPFDSPGELYRIRARQHPNSTAELECEQRPPPPPPGL